ncbi:uncharacterized protein EV420DRAFT_1648412 [Desarmillaria tabescens]|uniref:JmjC domain-containing protein n=1 Tax=Armillaria tabescens TaxID=1929756 RepID=A0AA39JMI4_ARMTA|nr:uncharacterized protein EV420DRAFT_1648412 [Desarmillaria tabescens]KAK0445274.1 hypothetical protein EV420DRAFT_1648412 [Desarmillaria tabescens]
MATNSPEGMQLQNSLVTGYTAAKQSPLVWSLPVHCKLFLLSHLNPDLWYELHVEESHQNADILQFGMAMGRSLKSVADKDWDKGHPSQKCIDSISGGRNANKSTGQLKTLVLVKAMDIAAGFLRLPCRSYYPSFKKSLTFDERQLGFLRRLEGWTHKLDEIATSLHMYNERRMVPLPPLQPDATMNHEILHADICLLANHWKHESVKNWLKVLCVLDGVAFHIRLLCYHNGVEQTTLWQRFINDNFDHPDVKMIMGNEETIKRFKKNLLQWKQAFTNAVTISPLVLIMGQGMGQTLNTPLALQVGGRLSSIGKPKLILRVEEILWKSIVGIAWGSWMSKIALSKFLAEVQPLVEKMLDSKAMSKDGAKRGWVGYEGEDTWFEDSITFIQQNVVPGLEAKIGAETSEWLISSRSLWIGKGGRKKDPVQRGRSSSCPPRWSKPQRKSQSLSPSRYSARRPAFMLHAWGHKHYPNFDERPEWQYPPTLPPLTVRDLKQIPVGAIIIGAMPPIRKDPLKTAFSLSHKQKIIHERKLSQDLDAGWHQLMLMAPSLRMGQVQDAAPSLSRRKRQWSSTVGKLDTRERSKKAKLDHGLSRSLHPITSPLVWAPAKKQYRTFDYYLLISNETDDHLALAGWNTCVRTDASGGPLYRLKETGKAADESMIVTLKQSSALKNHQGTLKTFRHYNILLYDTKTLPLTWSLASLSEIGNIDILQEVQDHHRRSSNDTMEQLHVSVSLREMYEEGLLEDGRILNALSLPCSTSYSGHPLQSIVLSHIRAFEQTSDLPEDIYTAEYPVSVTNCFGVGTIIEVLCRRKLWYVFKHGGCNNRQDSRIDEYINDWAPGFIPDPEEWTAEVVLLEPGSAFYMHPNTHHAVVTLENSIVKGHHFYSTVTLSKTVLGWVHTCMLGYTITNILHVELQEVLLRMMCYFGAVISDQGPENHDTDIPTMTRDGPLDFIALGNLCLFAPALYACVTETEGDSKPAIAMAAGAYISTIQCLQMKYCLVFLDDDKDVAVQSPESMMRVNDRVTLSVGSLDIADFARSSAAHFRRSLILYAETALQAQRALGQHESVLFDTEMFQQDIKDAMETYLQMELSSEFLKAYKRRKRKVLLLRPIFLVRQKAEVLQSDALEDWSETVDYDLSDGEEEDPKDEEDYPPTNVSNINDGDSSGMDMTGDDDDSQDKSESTSERDSNAGSEYRPGL